MTSSLVQRLRNYTGWLTAGEAADKIERLTAERDYWSNENLLKAEIERLTVENEQLKAEKNTVTATLDAAGQQLVNSLHLDNERLRAVLHEINENCPPDTKGYNGECFAVIREIVQEALEGR